MIEVAIKVQVPNEQIYRSTWQWDEIASEIVSGRSIGPCAGTGWRSPLDSGIAKKATLACVFIPS